MGHASSGHYSEHYRSRPQDLDHQRARRSATRFAMPQEDRFSPRRRAHQTTGHDPRRGRRAAEELSLQRDHIGAPTTSNRRKESPRRRSRFHALGMSEKLGPPRVLRQEPRPAFLGRRGLLAASRYSTRSSARSDRRRSAPTSSRSRTSAPRTSLTRQPRLARMLISRLLVKRGRREAQEEFRGPSFSRSRQREESLRHSAAQAAFRARPFPAKLVPEPSRAASRGPAPAPRTGMAGGGGRRGGTRGPGPLPEKQRSALIRSAARRGRHPLSRPPARVPRRCGPAVDAVVPHGQRRRASGARSLRSDVGIRATAGVHRATTTTCIRAGAAGSRDGERSIGVEVGDR